jgi:hypothetical protein
MEGKIVNITDNCGCSVDKEYWNKPVSFKDDLAFNKIQCICITLVKYSCMCTGTMQLVTPIKLVETSEYVTLYTIDKVYCIKKEEVKC